MEPLMQRAKRKAKQAGIPIYSLLESCGISREQYKRWLNKKPHRDQEKTKKLIRKIREIKQIMKIEL